MKNEDVSQSFSEHSEYTLAKMRHSMNIMRLAVGASEGISLNAEILSFLDEWIGNLDDLNEVMSGGKAA